MNKKLALSATLALVAVSQGFSTTPDFYASARFAAYGESVIDTGDAKNVTSTSYFLQPNSRFGAKLSSADSTVSGQFELGFNSGKGVLTPRLLYGTVKFNPNVSLLIGQNWSIITYSNNNQVWGVDNDLEAQGAIVEGRVPQVTLKVKNLQISLVPGKTRDQKSGTVSYTAKTATAPKVELAYDHSFGAAHLGGALGYYGYGIETDSAKGDLKDAYHVNSFVGVLDFGYTGKVNLAASAGYTLNGSDFGISLGRPFSAYVDSKGEVKNSSSILAYAALNIPVNEKINPEIGSGVEINKIPTGDKTSSNSHVTIYANTTINPVKHLSLVPEVGTVFEKADPTGDKSVKAPTFLYYGLKAQVNF